MLRAYKYRLYPTKKQEELINKSIGACRFVYNLALETRTYAYKSHGINLTGYALMKQLTQLKKDVLWLNEVDAQALAQSLNNLEFAFQGFLKGRTKYPQFKSKSPANQTFTNLHPDAIRISDTKLFIPKFRDGIKYVKDRELNGSIRSATVRKAGSGKYFVLLVVETNIPNPIKAPITQPTTIGIDLGIKSFIVTSEGIVVDNPKHLRQSLHHLKFLQRQVSKKKKGSANRRKAVHKLALCHEKVTNQRKDFLHKLSSELVKNHDTLCLEDLNIKGMVKNHNLAQSISDVGWGMFVEFCKYKAEWYGKNILQIPRFEPSTKICNHCSSVNDTLTLADREWVCANCGTIHNRDQNAAINIKNYCLKNFSGEAHRIKPAELPTLVGAKKQEVENQIAEAGGAELGTPDILTCRAGIEFVNGTWILKEGE